MQQLKPKFQVCSHQEINIPNHECPSWASNPNWQVQGERGRVNTRPFTQDPAGSLVVIGGDTKSFRKLMLALRGTAVAVDVVCDDSDDQEHVY